jgi:NAD(P)-dependent dehydrogenase (short-subunit alcohol dehydrogenase family)
LVRFRPYWAKDRAAVPGKEAIAMPTVVITGANRGVGLALARVYQEQGHRVIATARTPAQAADLGRVTKEIHQLDVTDEASFAAVSKALAGVPIDILIANAGMMGPRGAHDDPGNTAEIWAQVLATNVTGVFLTVRALASSVVAGKGRIAVISSQMGSSARASGSSYLYRASKAAASNIAANLAVEMKPKGVAVAAYHPGWVKTDMGGSAADITAEASARGLMARIAALDLNRSGVFEDYAGKPLAF